MFLPVSRSEAGLGLEVVRWRRQQVPPMVAEAAAAGGRSVRAGGLEKKGGKLNYCITHSNKCVFKNTMI